MHQHLGLNLGYVPAPYPPIDRPAVANPAPAAATTAANPAVPAPTPPGARTPSDVTLASYQARIQELELILARGNSAVAPAVGARIEDIERLQSQSNDTGNLMVAAPAAIAAAQQQAIENADNRKTVTLPPITAGHKSNALDLPVPPKVDAAFRDYCYIPYTALTQAARLRSARGEEDYILNAKGGLTVKGLSRENERGISTIEWLKAAKTAEERTQVYHGKDRGDALQSHHTVVLSLAHSHGWAVAVEYDIQQREAAANDHRHDLSGLDTAALTLITTSPTRARSMDMTAATTAAPVKRAALGTPANATQSVKRPRTESRCFRCGQQGHFPSGCTSSLTSAGRAVAPLLGEGSRSAQALTAPNGRAFCFNYALSSTCRFGADCQNFHGCSLCGDTSHGAGKCGRRV